MTRRHESGIAMVEFAVVAVVVFTVIFAVIEIGRTFYVYAMLDEATRRGARVAAVCPTTDSGVAQMAVFNAAGDASESSLVAGLTPANIIVEYLDSSGAVIGNPTDEAGFLQIRYVRVRLTGFEHQMNIPFVAGLTRFFMPEFATVLPRESLGIPREGAVTPC